MTYNYKKDPQRNWNIEQTMMNISNEEDQDIYISERSSMSSSDDYHIASSPPLQTQVMIIKQPPTPSPTLIYSQQKQIYVHRHSQQELNENGISPNGHIQFEKKDEQKLKKKPRRQGLLPPGGLTSICEAKTGDAHQLPHGNLHKSKVTNRKLRPRPLVDTQVNSYDSFDSPHNAAQAALITSSIKPSQPMRQTRRDGGINYEKPRSDVNHHSIVSDNDQQPKISPRQSIIGKDNDVDERRRNVSQQRRKNKVISDWSDHHVQSFSNKNLQDSPTALIITSNAIATRTTHRPKMPEKSPIKSDSEESHRYRSHVNHSPSIPSQQNHYTHHYYQHVRRRPPSGSHLTSELPVVDTTTRKYDHRLSQYQTSRELFHSPPPPPPATISTSTSYLPPITRENHSKANLSRFPNEYYGTLARQPQVKDWEESIEIPKIYKHDPQTRFYDRYLTIVPDKRLAA